MNERQKRWWQRVKIPVGWQRALLALFLVLFGALEWEAILDADKIAEGLSGLGIIGTIVSNLTRD